MAVSRNLRDKHNLRWGDKIYLEFEVQDLMGKTAQGKPIEDSIDMFVRNEKIALHIGKERRQIIIVKKQ